MLELDLENLDLEGPFADATDANDAAPFLTPNTDRAIASLTFNEKKKKTFQKQNPKYANK